MNYLHVFKSKIYIRLLIYKLFIYNLIKSNTSLITPCYSGNTKMQPGQPGAAREQPGTARGLEIAPGYIIVLNKVLF
jgi:hypothetical protein